MLVPEWQGYGLGPEAADGARVLARAWWGDDALVSVDAPRSEELLVADDVLGLESIARLAGEARDVLRGAAPARVQMVGGTCGADLAPVACMNDRYAGDLAVVWLDGHADLNTPALLAEVADLISGLHRHTDVVGFSVLEYCDRAPADRSRLLTVLRSAAAGACCR